MQITVCWISSRSLACHAPSGRQAGWPILQFYVDTLYPRGCRIKVIPCRKPKSMLGGQALNSNPSEIATSKIILPTRVRRYLSGRGRVIGKKGARIRNRRLTPQQRSISARKAALVSWRSVKARCSCRPCRNDEARYQGP
jgi:hypothetical protein